MTKKQSLGWRSRSRELIFFSIIGGASVLMGFGTTLALARKKDPESFAKGPILNKEIAESGEALALRALKRGTLYSIAGFSFICLIVWKAVGVSSVEELRSKFQKVIPQIPKHEPQGRNDFSSIRELVHYLIDEDKSTESTKKPS